MNRDSKEEINTLTSHLFRAHYGKMVSILSHKYGFQHIESILDSIQEAFETALKTWKFSEVPTNSFAWLCKVANRNLLNKLKRSNLSKIYINTISAEETVPELYTETEAEDSLLKLLIFFSSANFSERNKLITSLYFLCGFNYSEIANALLLQLETVKKVISRSKDAIKKRVKTYDDFHINLIEQPDHLLQIIYLLFNEGYKSSQKKGAINHELCFEAMRLAKLLNRHCAENPKVSALLASMFFHCSRFPARTTDDNWISLKEQNRNLWDKKLIADGFYHLKQAKENQLSLDKYYLEALISSIHCTAKTYENTDWKTIAYLYEQLEIMEPQSAALKLNRIIAESHFKELSVLLEELSFDEERFLNENAIFYFSTKAHFLFPTSKLEFSTRTLQIGPNTCQKQNGYKFY